MDRMSQLDDLKKFLSEKQSCLKTVLNEFDWITEDLLKGVPTESVEKTRALEKIDKNDEPLFPENLEWSNSVVMDNKILEEILKQNVQGTSQTQIVVPNKFSDLQVNFSRDQKLAIYEYVIKNTTKLSEPELFISIPSKKDEKKVMTFAEILALKRDLKRRRQKYRTTKTPPLSLTEDLRNLIELQMQAFIQYLSEQNSQKIDKNEKEPEAHCSSKMKSSSSSSKYHHHHHHRQKTDTKRKRSKSPKKNKKRSKSSHKSRSHHKDDKHHKSHKRCRSSS